MDGLTNRFKARLHQGDEMQGLWFGLANPIAAEICAQSAFDWLMIDAEHSPLSDKDILSCLQAIAPYDICPIVRPVSGDKTVLKRLCDVGVQTFLVPMIDDAYPPSGTRGLGTSMARAARWNMMPDYFARANDEMCVILQIETVAGLGNLTHIATVDGVDAVFIGPSDLGAALGYPGAPSHPDVVAAVSQAIRDVRACGKPVGVLAVTSDKRRAASLCGFRVWRGRERGLLMSLYQVQKLLYNLNRDPHVQAQFADDIDGLLGTYKLTIDERSWIKNGDVGALYIHGVNGQILMHYAAFIGQAWDDYIQAMKDGLKTHGQVRDGIYKAVDGGDGGAL